MKIGSHANDRLSLPAWERGLKPFYNLHEIIVLFVAPCVGAWIETLKEVKAQIELARRSLRGSVD